MNAAIRVGHIPKNAFPVPNLVFPENSPKFPGNKFVPVPNWSPTFPNNVFPVPTPTLGEFWGTFPKLPQ